MLGTLSGYKTRLVANCLENKLGISLGGRKELSGWYHLGGKKILRVGMPKTHGSSELSKPVAHRVAVGLRMTKEEFHLLYDCPMHGSDYEQKIRSLIASGQL